MHVVLRYTTDAENRRVCEAVVCDGDRRAIERIRGDANFVRAEVERRYPGVQYGPSKAS